MGGGAFGYGTVFELTPNGDGSWTESVLHSFNDSDGNNPYLSGVIFDEAGGILRHDALWRELELALLQFLNGPRHGVQADPERRWKLD